MSIWDLLLRAWLVAQFAPFVVLAVFLIVVGVASAVQAVRRAVRGRATRRYALMALEDEDERG